MNNVPLIQGNSTQEINTSIIALKKAAKELEDLNTLVNKKLAEVNEALSGDISDIQDKISALDLSQVGGSGYYIESLSQTDGKVSASAQAIADTVTSGNAHSVSSDAVYNAIGNINIIKTNANDCYTNDTRISYYRLTATAQNIPPLNSNIRYGVIESYTFNDGTNVRICQMWYNNADSTSSYVYIRNGTGTVNNITWGSWEKLNGRYSDYANGNLITSSVTSYTATEDCYCSFLLVAGTAQNRNLTVNGSVVSSYDSGGGVHVYSYCGYIEKGSVLRRQDNLAITPDQLKVFRLK